MEYTTEKIEQTRTNVMLTEQRIARQRRRVEKMLVERHPADEAQAQLMIMEQSLLAMTRFLTNLERDLEMGDLSLPKHQVAKRIKAAQSRPNPKNSFSPPAPDATEQSSKTAEKAENNS